MVISKKHSIIFIWLRKSVNTIIQCLLIVCLRTKKTSIIFSLSFFRLNPVKIWTVNVKNFRHQITISTLYFFLWIIYFALNLKSIYLNWTCKAISTRVNIIKKQKRLFVITGYLNTSISIQLTSFKCKTLTLRYAIRLFFWNFLFLIKFFNTLETIIRTFWKKSCYFLSLAILFNFILHLIITYFRWRL